MVMIIKCLRSLGNMSKSIQCCREGNIKLLRSAFAKFHSLLPSSTAVGEACSIRGLLAEWRGFEELLPNNKRQMMLRSLTHSMRFFKGCDRVLVYVVLLHKPMLISK